MKATLLSQSTGRWRFLLSLMLAVPALIVSLALVPSAAPSAAGSFVYVVTFNNQFGVVNLATGAFRQIGPPTPEPIDNLVWRNGSLLTLTASGELLKINPATGETSDIGPTGLGSNALDLGEVRGKLYATDFSNNLYSVNPDTGAATLLRATGIPLIPAAPFSSNTDGTINLFDESLYGVGGKLYATFDGFTIDPKSLAETPDDQRTDYNCCGPTLYQIDPSSGRATAIGSTDLNLGSAVELQGKFYAFKWVVTAWTEFGPEIKSQLFTVDLATGKAAPVLNAAGPIFVDAVAGGITGAVPAPATVAKAFAAAPADEQGKERKGWR
jgi:hypothetical protein